MTSTDGFRLESVRNPYGIQTPIQIQSHATLLHATTLRGYVCMHRRLANARVRVGCMRGATR